MRKSGNALALAITWMGGVGLVGCGDEEDGLTCGPGSHEENLVCVVDEVETVAGFEVGNVAPEFTLFDCDTNAEVKLGGAHSANKRGTYIVVYHHWCQVCNRHAEDCDPTIDTPPESPAYSTDCYENPGWGDIYDYIWKANGGTRVADEYLGVTCSFDTANLDFYVVVARNAQAEIATQAECQAYKTQFGWDFPVLYDPNDVMGTDMGLWTGGEILMTYGSEVFSRGAWGTPWQIWDLLVRVHSSGVCEGWYY